MQTFALDEAEVGIGREPANLEDAAVSMRHCVIRRREDGRFAIIDLNSRNGTFVNGLPAGERILEEGDEIRLGKSLFVFQVWEEDDESSQGLEHAIVLGSSNLILPRGPAASCDRDGARGLRSGWQLSQTVCEEKKRVILNALEQAGGVFTEATKLLGVHPNYLHRLVRNLNMRPAIKKSASNQSDG